jgi:alkylation response protein AidB-like acyl-CoA dehydrogenase
MYGLTEEDLRIRNTARTFVESLMPHEVEAELAGGLLPKEVTAEHSRRAFDLGLYATNMPTSVGGRGCTALQQVLVQEQCGRVTNGLAWVMATPPQWWPEVATD